MKIILYIFILVLINSLGTRKVLIGEYLIPPDLTKRNEKHVRCHVKIGGGSPH